MFVGSVWYDSTLNLDINDSLSNADNTNVTFLLFDFLSQQFTSTSEIVFRTYSGGSCFTTEMQPGAAGHQ